MAWKTPELAREAVANLGLAQAVLCVVATTLLLALGLLTIDTALGVITDEGTFRDEGGLVLVASARAGDGLSAARCDALARSDGVVAAGGPLVGPGPSLRLFAGDRELSSVYVTPGAMHAWGIQSRAGLWVGIDQAEASSIHPGTTLLGDDGLVRITGRLNAVPVDVLRSNLVSFSAPTSMVRECWIRFTPSAMSHARDLVGAAFGATDVDVRAFLERTELVSSPSDRWRSFVGREPWVICALLAGFASALVALSRRPEVGVYRALGTRSGELRFMFLVENLIILGIAASIAISGALSMGVLIHGNFPREVAIVAAEQISSGAMLAITLSTMLADICTRGSVIKQLKER